MSYNQHNGSLSDDDLGDLTNSGKIKLYIILIMGSIAFLAHVAILLIALLNRNILQTRYICAIMFLSTSDILTSLALIMISVINLVSLNQARVCAFAYFILQLGYITSFTHILIICTERYLSTRTNHKTMMTLPKRLVATLVNIGTCAVILIIPYIGLFTYAEPQTIQCNIVTLFADNLWYSQLPIRLVLFLLWSSINVVFGMTMYNFRRLMHKTERSLPQNIPNNNAGRHLTGECNALRQSTSGCQQNKCIFVLQEACKKQESTTKENYEHINDVTVKSKTQNAAGNVAGHQRTYTLESLSLNKCVDDVNGATQCNLTNYDARPAHLRTSSRDVQNISVHDSQRDTTNLNVPNTTQTRTIARLRRAYKTLAVIFVVFFIACTPQSVVGFVTLFSPISIKTMALCGTIASSSVMTNPIVYGLILPEFRKVIFNGFRKMILRRE